MSFLPELVVVEIFKQITPNKDSWAISSPVEVGERLKAQLPLLAVN